MEGKTYDERLHCLKLWTLEERRIRRILLRFLRCVMGCRGYCRVRLTDAIVNLRIIAITIARRPVIPARALHFR